MFTYIVDLANRMCQEMDVIIAYSTRKQTPKNYEEYFDKRIKLIKVNNFTRNINPFKDIGAIFEVRKIIKNEKPDIVHMHSSKAGAIGRLSIFSKEIKLFYTPHGYAFCKKDDSKLKTKLYEMIEKFLGKRKCTTIACSKGEYEESLKVTKTSMYINNGIDCADIDKIVAGKPKKSIDVKKLKICTVGRIGYQKNPKLFNSIAEKFPEIEFNWIGDGELREILTSSNINVTGWCDRKEALLKLCENDIFILPSLWEGLPLTLLEAMYLEKICIVSNVVGNKDVINNGINGFICETENEYYNILEKIINGEIDCEKIKSKSREKIISEHNVDVAVRKYIEIYRKGDDCY